ncbi:acyl-CoA dehydrogenase family protein [Gulosibacter chungangensis]|uniref:acyl-CoA dehydrogenase family protein n=1 Tax=Gulosibacter chungangensis TaxID=979746 RepID=UPI0017879447|nr:acyl-CoA dehydrogenase [Gulosibacter chungangensis]
MYEQVLRESATRPVLLNAARDEPRLGSFARGGKLATTVRRSENGWIVDGHKAFVTGASILDYHLLLVSEEDTGQIGRVIVPGGSAGISHTNAWDAVGMRASITHNVNYSGVEVPLGNFVPLDAELAPNRALIEATFMIGLSAIYLGVARSARDELVRFLHDRVPASLGAPLATVERLQDAVGEVTAHLQISETILYEGSGRIDRGVDPSDPLIASVKLHCTRASVRAVELAVQAAGSHGISAQAPLERHLRDVLCARLHPTPDDMLLRKLGNASLATEHWSR